MQISSIRADLQVSKNLSDQHFRPKNQRSHGGVENGLYFRGKLQIATIQLDQSQLDQINFSTFKIKSYDLYFQVPNEFCTHVNVGT